MSDPTPTFHPDDVEWVRTNRRPVTTGVGIRTAAVPDVLALEGLTELRAKLTPKPVTAPAPQRPAGWRRWGPHTSRDLAVARPDARGWHLPVTIHQLFGGKRWSLAIVQVGSFTKAPEDIS